MPYEEDDSLISRFRNGEEVALSELIGIHKGPLFGFIYRHVNDSSEAEDILYFTFVKAWQHRSNYRPNAQFRTWLYTIAGNLCRNHARKRKRHPADYAVGRTEFDPDIVDRVCAADRGENPAKHAVDRDEAALLRKVIDDLPHDLRCALIVFALEGHSQEESAVILGCSPKAVETRVYRARQQLRKQLRHLGGE